MAKASFIPKKKWGDRSLIARGQRESAIMSLIPGYFYRKKHQKIFKQFHSPPSNPCVVMEHFTFLFIRSAFRRRI